MARVEAARTETMPGVGMAVEHSEQVGMKWEGSMSMTVQPSRSR